MKSKVAIIIERADVALGGAERSVLEMAHALGTLGVEVHTLAAKGTSQAKNVHVLCSDVPGKRTSFRVFGRALRRHLEENKYDIVHSVLPFDFADIYQPRGGTYAESIQRNAASYGNKLVRAWKMATGFANIRRTELLRAEKRLCRMQNGPYIIAISNYVAEQFSRHYGVDQGRINVIANGVRTIDSADRAQAERLRAQILTELGIKEANDPVLFLFAGNNFRLKGLECLIKALQVVSQRQHARPAFLIVVGRGRQIRYKYLAARLKVSRKILFLGKLGHIAVALAVSDVAVLPTFQDACSRFILEALSVGKPIITTRFNGAADFFTDNRHGRVIDEPSDIAALADALEHFLEPGNIEKTSEAIVQDNLREQVSILRVAGQLKQFYDDILRKRGR